MSITTKPGAISDYSESLLVHFRRKESLRREALSFPAIDLTSRQLCDLELLLNRAFYPLTGFIGQTDYESILTTMRLANGAAWPLPICFDVNEKTASTLSPGQAVALNDQEGFMLAVLTITDIWKPDKNREALQIYGTQDPAKHPAVRTLFAQTGDWYIGGSLEGLSLPIHYDFPELRLTPAETHRLFLQNGWRNIIGFHTNNYIHRSQKEMILKAAREAGANIFLQPVVGMSHPGNLDHYTRVRCHEEIVKKYPRNLCTLGLLPLATRMAGPREALWHALIKRNYGCTHIMVSDDHADPFEGYSAQQERFYPKKAAQELVQSFEDETDIRMVPITPMVYVEEKATYLSADQLEPGMTVKNLTEAELKNRLENGLDIPEWFSYPEVLAELRHAFPPRSKQGFTVFITGLSGSGKSTLAKVLVVKFMEMRDRPVTLLDGDIVRKNLSSELSFSKEHRNLNITRIGFVASEITKNGGIAICAPIAPYEESRRTNRELISKYGGYIEVFMATPLEVCQQRDRKGLYAKAKAGTVKGVTGVSDPYVPPTNPDLTIDTSSITPQEAAQEVLLYLAEQGYIR